MAKEQKPKRQQQLLRNGKLNGTFDQNFGLFDAYLTLASTYHEKSNRVALVLSRVQKEIGKKAKRLSFLLQRGAREEPYVLTYASCSKEGTLEFVDSPEGRIDFAMGRTIEMLRKNRRIRTDIFNYAPRQMGDVGVELKHNGRALTLSGFLAGILERVKNCPVLQDINVPRQETLLEEGLIWGQRKDLLNSLVNIATRYNAPVLSLTLSSPEKKSLGKPAQKCSFLLERDERLAKFLASPYMLSKLSYDSGFLGDGIVEENFKEFIYSRMMNMLHATKTESRGVVYVPLEVAVSIANFQQPLEYCQRMERTSVKDFFEAGLGKFFDDWERRTKPKYSWEKPSQDKA